MYYIFYYSAIGVYNDTSGNVEVKLDLFGHPLQFQDEF